MVLKINPKYNNTCHNRIGFYRDEACYDCSHISECEQHYDETTGEWDYPSKIVRRSRHGQAPIAKPAEHTHNQKERKQ